MRRTLFRGFERGAVELAPALLGAVLVRVVDGERLSGRIVEVEAYPGGEDRASHSHGGRRTPRNESMYLAGGVAYVYFIYGMHHCLNVVAGRAGSGEAVLIRAIEPLEGVEAMRLRRGGVATRDLARGPGRLAEAIAIGRSLDGVRLSRSSDLWIEVGTPARVIAATPRIGLGRVGAWASRRWRFVDADSSFISDAPRRRS